MKEKMTICECCEYLANMTDDKSMLDCINYIETKVIHMTVKLYDSKKEVEKLEYLYQRSLDDYIKQFDELRKYKKALDKACHKLSIMCCDTDDERSTWNKKQWKEW